jgi:hypothetical protein
LAQERARRTRIDCPFIHCPFNDDQRERAAPAADEGPGTASGRSHCRGAADAVGTGPGRNLCPNAVLMVLRPRLRSRGHRGAEARSAGRLESQAISALKTDHGAQTMTVIAPTDRAAASGRKRMPRRLDRGRRGRAGTGFPTHCPAYPASFSADGKETKVDVRLDFHKSLP